MGGTFLLRIIIGTRFRRCVMLPNHVVVVEDGFPAPSKGVTKAADPERTPTKRVVEKEDSSAISVRDFVHSSAISERMPWDLADVLESSSEGTGNQSAAAIYADFMYQTVRLATERDLNAIAARLPAPSSLNCETYASIIASGNATHVQASEDTLRDLIVYARWSDVSITVEADKVRRPRTPSSRPSFTSAPPAARAGPAAPAAPAASPTPSFTVAAPVAAPTLHGQSPQTRHAISEDSASRAESGQQREAKSNSQDNHKRRKKHRSSPEPRTWDVPRRRDDEDDEPPDHRPGPAIRPRRGGDVAAPSGIRDDRGVQTGQPVGSAGTGRQDDISPDRLHITDPDHLGGASVSAPAWWIQSREDEAGLRSDIAHAASQYSSLRDLVYALTFGFRRRECEGRPMARQPGAALPIRRRLLSTNWNEPRITRQVPKRVSNRRRCEPRQRRQRYLLVQQHHWVRELVTAALIAAYRDARRGWRPRRTHVARCDDDTYQTDGRRLHARHHRIAWSFLYFLHV